MPKKQGEVIQMEGEISGVCHLSMKQMWSEIFPSPMFANCKNCQHRFISYHGYLHLPCNKLTLKLTDG